MIDPHTLATLISVDPGCGATAWALWRRAEVMWRLSTVGHLARPERGGIVALRVRDVFEDLAPHVRVTCLVLVEDQWLGRRADGASPHADVLALTRQRRTWEVCAELIGLAHEVVPARWVGRMTKGGPACSDHGGRRPSERRLIARGRVAWPGLRVGDQEREPTADEWAAIQLGEYWLTEHRQQIDRGRR